MTAIRYFGDTLLLVLLLSGPTLAEEISGQITQIVDRDHVTILVSSDLLPVAGDPLQIVVEIPGVGAASVAQGKVTNVEGDRVAATIESATGVVKVGQQVVIQSASPNRRNGMAIPILIGMESKTARQAAERAGLKPEFMMGLPAPSGVQPLTVYRQNPPIGTQVSRGDTVTLTLYTADEALRSNPASRSPKPTTARRAVALSTSNADSRDARFPPSDKVEPNQPWLGVFAATQDDKNYVVGVLEDGPAGIAGLQVDDVILTVGDQEVDSVFCARQRRLIDAVRQYSVGDVVPVTFRRGHQLMETDVTLQAMPLDGGNGRFLTAAGDGEPWAMCVIGYRLMAGHQGKATYLTKEQQDHAQGLSWLRKSIDAGCPDAARLLGRFYAGGQLGLDKDPREGARLFEQARQLAGNVKNNTYQSATESYADLLLDKESPLYNPTRGSELYREIAEAGSSAGANKLGQLYSRGEGVPQDNSQALHWQYTAAQAGHSFAQCELGIMSYQGRGVEQNDENARAWFKQAANQENSTAMLYLGEMDYYGRGRPASPQEAVTWYRKAADAAYSNYTVGLARYLEGRAYEEHGSELGLSDAQARSKAIELYHQAEKWNETARGRLSALEPRTIAGWGDVMDPAGAARISSTANALKVVVPAGVYDLWYERNEDNAPRVLQRVSGDFTVQVKVTADCVGPERDSGGMARAAGLVVYESATHYLRAERNRFIPRSGGREYSWTPPLYDRDQERHTAWKLAADDVFSGKATWLRLQRRGNIITTYTSSDGRRWRRGAPVNTTFPHEVQVGVLVINYSSGEFPVTFEEFSLLRN